MTRPDPWRRAGSGWTRRRYWNLLREVAVSEYKLRDQHTMLGFLWSFLHPLLILGVLFAFFSHHLGKDIEHYPVFLLIALVHFTHFSNATTGGMMVLYNLRQLTGNTILPKEVLVVGAVLAKTPELAISILLCVGIAWGSGVSLAGSVLLLPVILVIQVLLVLWVSLALSAVYVFVKDAAYVYQALLRVLFLATPTFYAADFVGDGAARWALVLNPLAQVIGFSRVLILEGGSIPPAFLGALVLGNGLLVGLVLVFFRRLEPRFAEHV